MMPSKKNAANWRYKKEEKALETEECSAGQEEVGKMI